jgi:hypothetical protein
MMDHPPKPPEALMQAIAADLKPVKPSPLPHRLALRMAPLALLVSSVILLIVGIRNDWGILGPLLTWGASSAQFVLALVLIWIAARESRPAGRLPKEIVIFAAVAAALLIVIVSLSTAAAISPAGATLRVPPWIMGLVCGVGSTLAGGILVLLFSWIFRSSLAARPTVAGALYGAGAGVAINASWRLACPISTLGHALGAHGTAVIATVVLGGLIGRSLGARRLRGVDRRS